MSEPPVTRQSGDPNYPVGEGPEYDAIRAAARELPIERTVDLDMIRATGIVLLAYAEAHDAKP